MTEDIGRRLVEAIDEFAGTREGFRAAHAKGVCCEGTWTASAAAAKLTGAPHMQGGQVPALVRFSNAGSDPESADYRAEVFGMAVKFLLPDGRETDIVANNLPVFFVRDPEAFLALTKARRLNPKTRRPAPHRILAFVLTHPESARAIIYSARHLGTVPASRVETAYNGLHSFRWVDPAGTGRHLRYTLTPEAGVRVIARGKARTLGRDYLEQELTERLARGPAGFRLSLQLAAAGDRVNDPTKAWPQSRERVDAGRLEIERLVADPVADCERRVFDPTRVIDGIECSADLVLAARRAAYSVSIERRLAQKAE